MQIWKIRAGRSGEYWESWNKNSIITIGWDVGDLRELNWEETKEIIEEKYPNSDSGQAAGQMRTVAGVRKDDKMNMKAGDMAVVLGEATVLGIANVGEYRYVKDGIEENKTHTYQRDVEYLFEGPVRIRDLPERFRQGGEYSLLLPRTIMRFSNASEEVIEDLQNELKKADIVDTDKSPFIEFSEASLQDYIESNYKELNEDIVELEREYPTLVGNADFGCETKEGEILVIETKIGTANDSTVGQI